MKLAIQMGEKFLKFLDTNRNHSTIQCLSEIVKQIAIFFESNINLISG